MGEVATTNLHHRKGAGVKKMKKQTTRIDLTPMVDLGFLLITFFIFTTSMTVPHAMDMKMPNDQSTEPMPVKQSGALTIMPGSNHTVYYYEGAFAETAIKQTTMGDLRQIIIDKKKRTAGSDLFIVIKPGKESVYEDLVNVMDEMVINDIERYAIADIESNEAALVQ